MKRFPVLKLIPMIFLSSLLLAGCSDEPSCPDHTEKYSYIYDWARSRIPYTGSDTLRFIDQDGDTVMFYGSGKTQHQDIEMMHQGDPACNSYEKTIHEAYSINFVKGNDSVFLRQSANTGLTGGLLIQYDGVKFNILDIAISNKAIKRYAFFDSVWINEKKYYEVSGIKSNDDSIYLNKDSGIIRVRLNKENKSLTLTR